MLFNNPLLNSLVGNGSPIKSKMRRLSADSDDFDNEHTWEVDHDLYKKNETDLDMDKLHVQWFGNSQNRRRPGFCQLEVTCIKAEELDISSSTQRHCDPYVILSVAGQTHQTKEHRRKFNPFWYRSFSSNPFFDETFTFSNVPTRDKIRLEVCDFDQKLLGYCDVSISQLLEFDADLIDVERVLPIAAGRLICSFRVHFPKSVPPVRQASVSKKLRPESDLTIHVASPAVTSFEPEHTPETHRLVDRVKETSAPERTPPRKLSLEQEREGSPEVVIVSENLFSSTPSKSHGVSTSVDGGHTDEEPQQSGSRSRTGSGCYEQKLSEEDQILPRKIESPRERGRRASESLESPRGRDRRQSESTDSQIRGRSLDSPRERGRRQSESLKETGRRHSYSQSSQRIGRRESVDTVGSFSFPKQSFSSNGEDEFTDDQHLHQDFHTKCLVAVNRIKEDETFASIVLEDDFLEVTALIEIGCLDVNTLKEALTIQSGEYDFIAIDTILKRTESNHNRHAPGSPFNRKVSYEVPQIHPELANALHGARSSPEREIMTPERIVEEDEVIEFFSYIDHDLPDTSRDTSRESSPDRIDDIPTATDFFNRRNSQNKERKPLPIDWGSVCDMMDDISSSDEFEENSIILNKSRNEVVVSDPPKRKGRRKRPKRSIEEQARKKAEASRPSFSRTRQIMAKRRAEVRRKQAEIREKERRQKKVERKLGPRDIGRKSKKSYQEPDYPNMKIPDNFLKPPYSTSKSKPSRKRLAERKLGPRDIGRKSKNSYSEPDYNLRKESAGIYTPRIEKITRPPKAPRKLGPREIGRKSKLSYDLPNYESPHYE